MICFQPIKNPQISLRIRMDTFDQLNDGLICERLKVSVMRSTCTGHEALKVQISPFLCKLFSLIYFHILYFFKLLLGIETISVFERIYILVWCWGTWLTDQHLAEVFHHLQIFSWSLYAGELLLQFHKTVHFMIEYKVTKFIFSARCKL